MEGAGACAERCMVAVAGKILRRSPPRGTRPFRSDTNLQTLCRPGRSLGASVSAHHALRVHQFEEPLLRIRLHSHGPRHLHGDLWSQATLAQADQPEEGSGLDLRSVGQKLQAVGRPLRPSGRHPIAQELVVVVVVEDRREIGGQGPEVGLEGEDRKWMRVVHAREATGREGAKSVMRITPRPECDLRHIPRERPLDGHVGKSIARCTPATDASVHATDGSGGFDGRHAPLHFYDAQ